MFFYIDVVIDLLVVATNVVQARKWARLSRSPSISPY